MTPPPPYDYYLALDPGDVHVGWAEETQGQPVSAGEWTPKQAVTEVMERIQRALGEEWTMCLILEEFVLYPTHVANQSFSPMKTSQLIGGIKTLVQVMYGFELVTGAERAGKPLVVIEQGAYIKKPTRRQLVGRGVKQVGSGTHARDAELHLYHRVLRDREETAK